VNAPAAAVAGPPPVVPRRRALEALFLTLSLALALTLNLARLGATSLLGDEAIFANPARAAAVHGHWYPLISGDHFFVSKPPLMVWPVALSFAVLGVSEEADRLPSAVAGAALVGVVYGFASWLLGPWPGLLAATLLASCRPWLFQHGAREGVGDPLLCLLIAVALLLYLRYRSTGRRAWLGAACAAAAVTGLTKGLIGPLFLGVITVVWEILRLAVRRPEDANRVAASGTGAPDRPGTGDHRWPRSAAAILPAVALAAAGAVAYLGWMLDSGRRVEHLGAFVYHDTIARTTVGLDPGHLHGVGFYAAVLGEAFGHWWPAIVPALVWLWRLLPAAGARQRAALLVAVWPVVVLALLSLSVSKLAWYLDPALPPLAILLAAGCGEVGRRLARWRLARLAFAVLVVLLAGLRVGLAWQTLERPAPPGVMYRFVQALRRHPGAQLYLGTAGMRGARLREWNRFYLSELEGVSRPLPRDLPAVTGCTFVIAEHPAELAARLGAAQWSAVPIERHAPEEVELFVIDFCGGGLAAELGRAAGAP
jgi:4-amino-4-deoxy-L-arabinose transferase-like glycosyltransferase